MRTPLLLIAPLALLAACSSGGSSPHALRGTSSAAPAVSSPSAPAAGSGGVPSTRPSSAATQGNATSAPQATSAGSTAPLSTKAPGQPAASKATKPGHYTYTSSGKVTFGTQSQDSSGSQTLTVSPLRGDVQHSTLHSDDSGDTEQDVVVRDSGSYAASLKLTSPAFSKEFRPATPVLLMPDPAAVGRKWSWSMTSTDGKTHAAATNQLLRKETVTIGGTRVDTVVLQTHLVLSGDVNLDTQVTMWWAPAYRLPVKNHSTGKGSFSGVPFTTDVTAVLKSVQPS